MVSALLAMVTILKGTALSQDIAQLRDATVLATAFRATVHRIGLHLAVEASKHLPGREVDVLTPLEQTTGRMIDGDVVVIPILRAGLGLLPSMLEILPSAHVGYIGLRRNDASLQPESYYQNLPTITTTTTTIIIDPMLATGGSMSAAIDAVRRAGARSVIAVCLIAAPEGIARIRAEHPDTRVIAAVLDRGLNDQGYILPGLGDAGDRQFGTY